MTVSPTTRGGGLWGISASRAGVKKPPRGEGVQKGSGAFPVSRSRDECNHNLSAAVLGLALCGRIVVRRLGRTLGDGGDPAGVDAVAGDEVLLGGLGPLHAELLVRLVRPGVVGEACDDGRRVQVVLH